MFVLPENAFQICAVDLSVVIILRLFNNDLPANKFRADSCFGVFILSGAFVNKNIFMTVLFKKIVALFLS